MAGTATLQRKTKETDISLSLTLDGTGKSEIASGIGFFDHMLEGFARHGFFDLTLSVNGDLQVDGHHTVEDTGIVLGQAIKEAAGDKAGMKRYGFFILPMDEAPSIYAAGLILTLPAISKQNASAHWKQSLCGNFSTRFPTVRV